MPQPFTAGSCPLQYVLMQAVVQEYSNNNNTRGEENGMDTAAFTVQPSHTKPYPLTPPPPPPSPQYVNRWYSWYQVSISGMVSTLYLGGGVCVCVSV